MKGRDEAGEARRERYGSGNVCNWTDRRCWSVMGGDARARRFPEPAGTEKRGAEGDEGRRRQS